MPVLLKSGKVVERVSLFLGFIDTVSVLWQSMKVVGAQKRFHHAPQLRFRLVETAGMRQRVSASASITSISLLRKLLSLTAIATT